MAGREFNFSAGTVRPFVKTHLDNIKVCKNTQMKAGCPQIFTDTPQSNIEVATQYFQVFPNSLRSPAAGLRCRATVLLLSPGPQQQKYYQDHGRAGFAGGVRCACAKLTENRGLRGAAFTLFFWIGQRGNHDPQAIVSPPGLDCWMTPPGALFSHPRLGGSWLRARVPWRCSHRGEDGGAKTRAVRGSCGR